MWALFAGYKGTFGRLMRKLISAEISSSLDQAKVQAGREIKCLRVKNSELTAKSFPFKIFLASVLKEILSLDTSSELLINRDNDSVHPDN